MRPEYEDDLRGLSELVTLIVGIVCVVVALGIAIIGLAYFLHVALTIMQIGHYWGGSWIGF